MNQFLMIFRGGAIAHKDVAPQQLQEHLAKWGVWMAELQKSGNVQGANALENTGRTVRGSKKAVTDGPFTEAKELVGGFAILRANSKEEAIQLAKDFLRVVGNGECELRQLYEADTCLGATA